MALHTTCFQKGLLTSVNICYFLVPLVLEFLLCKNSHKVEELLSLAGKSASFELDHLHFKFLT